MTIGLHLILLAAAGDFEGDMLNLDDDLKAAGEKHNVQVKELAIREDHIHLLCNCDDESAAAEFIAGSMEACEKRGLECSDRVHVTLLPPWHLEILASFLRDQDRYHETRTVEQEIDEIFRPNSVGAPVVIEDIN